MAEKKAMGFSCNNRKAAKRDFYPWINRQIMAMAETKDLERLVSTIQTYLPQMNFVNLSTALHRLAKLAPGGPSKHAVLRDYGLLDNMAECVGKALRRAEANDGPPQCQALANIAWSWATLHFVDLALLEDLISLGIRHIYGFKSFELSTILWSFGKLGTFDAGAWTCSHPLFAAAAWRITSCSEDFNFSCLVMMAWAFATAGFFEPALFYGISPRLMALAHSGNGHELASAVWSFSAAGIRHDMLIAELARLAERKLGDLASDEFKGLLRSLLALGFASEAFAEKAVAAAEELDPDAQRVAKALLVLMRSSSERIRGAGCPQAAVHGGARYSRRDSGGRHHLGAGAISLSSLCSEASDEAEVRLQPALQAPAVYATGLGGSGAALQEAAEERPWLCSGSGGAAPWATVAPASSLTEEESETKAEGPAREAAEGASEGTACKAVAHDGEGGCGREAAEAPAAEERQQEQRQEQQRQQRRQEEERSREGGARQAAPGAAAPRAARGVAAPDWARGLCVKNTFLHIEEEKPGDELRRGAPLRPLPPLLEIIPKGISLEELTAYRADYQRFRAGCAAGARGELTSGVV